MLGKIFKVGTGKAINVPAKESRKFEWETGQEIMISVTKDKIIIEKLV